MSSESSDNPDDDSPEELAALEAALQVAPRGAIAVAGTAVILLMIAWFAMYLFVFLPRGTVG